MLAALLSALFASCKDDNEDETVVDRRNPNSNVISFSTYTAGATRGTVVDAADIENKGFNVSAWYDSRLHFKDGASYTEVINGDKIFDTEATYYWPTLSADKSIDFRAFNISSGGDWVDGNCNSIKFDVKETASAQKDLVVAYASATSRPDQGVQPLNFIHALSKINFSFTGADAEYTYTINKVEVIAAGKNGTDNPELTIGETNSWDFTAINGDNPLVVSDKTTPANGGKAAQGVLYTYKTGDVVVNGTTADLNENFMLLPQTGKIAIRVYYKVEDGDELKGNCGYYKTNSDGGHDETNANEFDGVYGCKTLIVDLGEVIKDEHNPLGWQAGKSYRFVITLPTDNFLGDGANGNEPDGVADESDEGQTEDYDGDGDKDKSEFGMDEGYIEFSVSVKPWVDENYNANIVIK